MASRKRRQGWFRGQRLGEPDSLLGLDLDQVLEEHEHTGEVDPSRPGRSGAEFLGKQHRREKKGLLSR
jgi:hypothetical protein